MAEQPALTTLSIFRNPTVDLTTDEQFVLLSGILEGDTAVRIPMSVETAMQLLKLLMVLRDEKQLSLPDSPVDVGKMQ